jgi:hypothetical protein
MAPEERDEETVSAGGDTVARDALYQPKGGAEETGDLAQVSLESVLTNLFCARSTGTLTIAASAGEPAAEVTVWKGDVLAASSGKLLGEEVVLALLQRRSGTFRFTEELEPCEQNVRRSVPELVAEAARRRGDKRPGPR